jgi:hypothetical protein
MSSKTSTTSGRTSTGAKAKASQPARAPKAGPAAPRARKSKAGGALAIIRPAFSLAQAGPAPQTPADLAGLPVFGARKVALPMAPVTGRVALPLVTAPATGPQAAQPADPLAAPSPDVLAAMAAAWGAQPAPATSPAPRTPRQPAAPKQYGSVRAKDLPWCPKKVAIFKALQAAQVAGPESAVTMAELAGLAGVRPVDARHYTYHAAAGGLCVLLPNPAAPRSYVVHLTPAGLAAVLPG